MAAHAQVVTGEIDVTVRVLGSVQPPKDQFAFQVDGGTETPFTSFGTNQVTGLDVSVPHSITPVEHAGFISSIGDSPPDVTCTAVIIDPAAPTPPFCMLTFTFIEPTTTTTTTTTTTLPPTTTTAPAHVGQHPVQDSATDVNNCTSVLVPDLQPPGKTKITVSIATTASPQPHFGDPIVLSGTSVTLTIPASLLQLGYNAGLIHNGDQVPSTVNFTVTGVNTTEGSHAYVIHQTATIVIKGTKAQPLTAHINLPDTNWTPVSGTDDVIFSEKNLKIVSKLNLPGIGNVTVTFTCSPSTAASFVALGATGIPTVTSPPPTAGPTLPGGGTGGTGSGSGGLLGGQAAGGATQLPRTGSSPWPLFVVAAVCIDLGMLAIAAAKRRRRPLHQA